MNTHDTTAASHGTAGDGTLERAGERWRLRFTRRLAQPPATVWRALTEPEHLAAWFPQRIDGKWAVGTPLRFLSQYGDFEGEVLAVTPPSLLEFRWGTDLLRLEVAADGDGSILTLLHTFDEQGKAARDAAGWHVCLDALERHLAGAPQAEGTHTGWHVAHERYAARFGAEAATLGPPRGEDTATSR